MLILRHYAPLVFLNARVLSNELRTLALGREDIRGVVLDATASSGIDSTAANAFIAAREDLAAAGIALWVVTLKERRCCARDSNACLQKGGRLYTMRWA